MKKIRIFYLFFNSFFSLSAALATNTEEVFPNQENAQIKKPLKEVFRGLQDEIEKARKDADTDSLGKVYKLFQGLEYSNEAWKELKANLTISQFSSQTTDKESAGAFLFYPVTFIDNILDSTYTAHLLKRRDILWSVIYSAKFNHPAGKFYTAYIIDQARNDFRDTERPPFLTSLYNQAFNELQQVKDNADACYLLGLIYTTYSKVGLFNLSPNKAVELSLRNNDLKNQFRILILKAHYKIFSESPQAKEFIKFARDNKYGPAYVEAAEMTEDYRKKLKYLKEAVQVGYAKAFMNMGHLYKQNGQIEEANNSFVEARKKGISQGYIEQAIMLIGKKPKDLKSSALIALSNEKLTEAANLFLKAGSELKDYTGFEHLADLYLKLAAIDEKKKNSYRDNVSKFLIQGIKLGSLNCYHTFHTEFPEKFKQVVERYGRPPQEKFYLSVEEFLK